MDNSRTSLGYRFGLLFRLDTYFVNQKLKPLDLTSGQVACLAELFHRAVPLTQDEISKDLIIDPAATARTVEVLIKKGLVERRENPHNRRQKLVSVTPEGNAIKHEFFFALKEVENLFEAVLSEEERLVVIKLMDRMISSAGQERYGR